MIYNIIFNKDAKKFIEKQPKNQRIRIYEAINKLPLGDTKRLKGFSQLFRLRIGDYRIIYSIFESELVIEIIDANNRGEIYKKY